MSQALRICFLSAEVAPFAKVGGLADVAGSLPKAIHALGNEIFLVLPKYGIVDDAGQEIERTDIGPLEVRMGSRDISLEVWRGRLPGSDVAVYFLGNDALFEKGVYADPETGQGYASNTERFVAFSIGSLELLRALGKPVDVIHLNDNHVGLVPLYLKHRYADDPVLKDAATLITIHNLAYQGAFPVEEYPILGLPDQLASPGSSIEACGQVNMLKAGLMESNVISTVSETYSREIQTEEHGAGLDEVLRCRRDVLSGILNGADYSVWDPQVDDLLPHRYGPDRMEDKAENKKVLLETVGLPADRARDVPLIGIISRLVEQKGFDILEEALPEILGMDLQIVVLGTGEERYHRSLTEAAETHPDRLAVRLAFDNGLAHLIEAGSDMFLMPSRFEPSGLNQIYSLRYGAVPVVRATGGLADTIVDYEEAGANGFVFKAYEAEALTEAVRRAVECYRDTAAWSALVQRGMRLDFSWGASARKYVELYREAKKILVGRARQSSA
ncbi:MAG: glycogen synthase GlgA [Candidatus Eisenbacteria sp.]|nr:glycogen synthase GlgA [Candidatus Eisenbacteria bacterium]